MNNYNQRFKDCTLNDINAQALRNAWLYKSSNRFYSFFFTGVFYSRKLAENREGFWFRWPLANHHALVVFESFLVVVVLASTQNSRDSYKRDGWTHGICLTSDSGISQKEEREEQEMVWSEWGVVELAVTKTASSCTRNPEAVATDTVPLRAPSLYFSLYLSFLSLSGHTFPFHFPLTENPL